MNLTTKRELIRAVASRWRQQYEPFSDDRPMFSWRTGVTSPPLNKKQIAEKLDTLDGETATAEEVAAIIGNESWTRLTCDECGLDVDSVLTVGQAPDYESRTASICQDCAAKVAAISWENVERTRGGGGL